MIAPILIGSPNLWPTRKALRRMSISSRPRLRATTAPDLELRRNATKALAHIGDLATVQALADRLGDDDKEVRLAAVEGLGEMKVAAAIPGLTRALNDRDPEVRRAAAEALGKTQEN